MTSAVLTRHSVAHGSTLPQEATLEQLLAAQEPFVITIHSDEPYEENGKDIAWGGHQRRWFWIADYDENESHSLEPNSNVFEQQPRATQPWDADKMIQGYADRYRIVSIEQLKEDFRALGYVFKK